ncbi:MAG: VOC family protein [Oscillospiraceae bacterium]|nr:VOC family protein [Oscillospiraceae bacterium]
MYRSMMQVYVKESNKALEFYQKAFDAKLLCKYISEKDGTVEHSELDIYGQIFAVSEQNDNEIITGNTMQFCLHFGEGKESEVQKAFDVLKEGAKIICSHCDYSPLMWDLIDKYGVRWCIFV